MSTGAKVFIGNYVMIAYGCTIITGNHRTDLVGKLMCNQKNEDKLPENDEDIVIEDDVWIGAKTILLKGVRIGKGSVIGAGSVVTHDVEPYSVYAGNPAKLIRKRFDEDSLKKHISILEGNGKN